MGNKVTPRDTPVIEDSYEIQCENGKRKIWCKQWKPKSVKRFRCAVYICHGLGEHCMVYDSIAQLWAERYDALVFANDHMGHGRSEGQPRAYTDSLDTFVLDVSTHVNEMYKRLKTTENELPLFVFGHSMGGAISLLFSIRSPKLLTGGLMLMGPLIAYSTSSFANLIKRNLAKTVGRFLPASLPVTTLLYSDCVTDADWADEFENDPLRYHGWIRLGIVRAMFNAVEEIERKRDSFGTPIFVGHGTKDKLCSVEASELFVKSIRSTVKTLKLYEGGAHCLLHEVKSGIRDQLIADLNEWLDARLKDLENPSAN